jgi:GTP-binding protein HflX
MIEVQRVLAEIGASDIPQVLVFNKLDRLDETQRPRELRDLIEVEGGKRVPRVFISAQTGEGMSSLRAVLSEAVGGTLDGFLNRDDSAQDDIRLLNPPSRQFSAAHSPLDTAGADESPASTPTATHHSIA